MKRMNKERWEKAIAIIKEQVKEEGYKERKGKYVISALQLCYNINNRWDAEYFVTERKRLLYCDNNQIYKKRPVIKETYNLLEMMMRIRRACEKSKSLKIRKQSPYSDWNTYIILEERN